MPATPGGAVPLPRLLPPPPITWLCRVTLRSARCTPHSALKCTQKIHAELARAGRGACCAHAHGRCPRRRAARRPAKSQRTRRTWPARIREPRSMTVATTTPKKKAPAATMTVPRLTGLRSSAGRGGDLLRMAPRGVLGGRKKRESLTCVHLALQRRLWGLHLQKRTQKGAYRGNTPSREAAPFRAAPPPPSPRQGAALSAHRGLIMRQGQPRQALLRLREPPAAAAAAAQTAAGGA